MCSGLSARLAGGFAMVRRRRSSSGLPTSVRRTRCGPQILLTTALVFQMIAVGLPEPLASVSRATGLRLGVLPAAASILPPTTAATDGALKWWEWAPRLFTMSDGARVVIYLQVQTAPQPQGYRILPLGGTWGSFTQLAGNPFAPQGMVFRQVGNTIYGLQSSDVLGSVKLVKMVYSGGAISQTSASVFRPSGMQSNYALDLYWDATNSYLQALYWVQDSVQVPPTVYVDAYDTSLVNHASLDVTAYTYGGYRYNHLAGDGTNNFFLSAVGVGQVTAVAASGTGYTLTSETGIPTFGIGPIVWDGTNLVFFGGVTGGFGWMMRTAPNTYTTPAVLITTDMDASDLFVVRRDTGPSSDLALLFRDQGGQNQRGLWELDRS